MPHALARTTAVASATTATATVSRPPRRREGGAGRTPALNPATRPARIDPEMSVALIELLREQRAGEAFAVAEAMQARGADPTVCAFLGDDLREAAHALADVETWLQTSLDVLDRPAASTLFEQASDVSVLENLEHLFQTVDNLRRRLLQASVGLR